MTTKAHEVAPLAPEINDTLTAIEVLLDTLRDAGVPAAEYQAALRFIENDCEARLSASEKAERGAKRGS